MIDGKPVSGLWSWIKHHMPPMSKWTYERHSARLATAMFSEMGLDEYLAEALAEKRFAAVQGVERLIKQLASYEQEAAA
jgi:hypothetical protein